MDANELAEFIDICRQGRANDGGPDVIRLLGAIAWNSPEEKAELWAALTPRLKEWLHQVAVAPPTPDPAMDEVPPAAAPEPVETWGLTPHQVAAARAVAHASMDASDGVLELRLRSAGVSCPIRLVPQFRQWLLEGQS